MTFQSFLTRSTAGSLAAIFVLFAAAAAQTPKLPHKEFRIAEGNNLYCAGYVQTAPINTSNKIIGAVEEQDGHIFSQFNYVYLNMGANSGLKEGDVLSVVRPRGQVTTKWTSKNDLGFYVQEVGAVEVVRVKSDVSVARIKTSCESFLLGDLVRPMETRVSPMYEDRPAMDLFGDPSGKAVGRLFMARGNREALTRDDIVYVDLGADNNVRVGDRLTVFRPLGKGNVLKGDDHESVQARMREYQSDVYRGGKFSNQAPRKSGDTATGRTVTTDKVKNDRPNNIRKVVGEMVVLNVKEKTATAVIVRTAQEIHTGDWVEVQ